MTDDAPDRFRGRRAIPIPELSLTLSIGVATLLAHQDRAPTDLVRAANEALYMAKKAGRNRVCPAQQASSVRAFAALAA
jgi:GGDEF domain-containing protein